MAKKKKRRVSKKSIEAGTKNLLAHRPRCPNLRHGIWSRTVHARFEDGRTKEARELKARMDGLIGEAGGISRLSPAMWACLGRIKDVLKTLILARNWMNNQSVVSIFEDGRIPRALSEYLAAERVINKSCV